MASGGVRLRGNGNDGADGLYARRATISGSRRVQSKFGQERMLSSLGQAPHPVVLFLYIKNLNYLRVCFRIVRAPSMHAKLVGHLKPHSRTAPLLSVCEALQPTRNNVDLLCVKELLRHHPVNLLQLSTVITIRMLLAVLSVLVLPMHATAVMRFSGGIRNRRL